MSSSVPILPMTGCRRGFTLPEILTSVLILAIIGAVAYPAVLGKIRDGQVSALSQTLLGLSQGMAEYKKATTKYPEQLAFLTRAPLATELDACGNAIGATAAGLWRGPYVSREILTTGVAIGDAVILNDVRRGTSGASTYLFIDATGVEQAAVTKLESQLDNVVDAAAGTIRYTTAAIAAQVAPANPTAAIPAAPAGTYNLTYSIPISGC